MGGKSKEEPSSNVIKQGGQKWKLEACLTDEGKDDMWKMSTSFKWRVRKQEGDVSRITSTM